MQESNCTLRLPSETCILCGKSLKDIGGKRIVSQHSKGIALSNKHMGGGNPDHPYQSVKLHDDKDLFVVVWGNKQLWTDLVINRARDEFLKDRQPWYCQVCANYVCNICHAPINYPMGSDILYDDGRCSHIGIFGFNPGCSNPTCKKYKKWELNSPVIPARPSEPTNNMTDLKIEAEQGSADAQFHLAVAYMLGQDGKQDLVEAVKWFRKAADQGDSLAQYNLGNAYEYGEGVEQDSAEAVKWFTKSAEMGCVQSQYSLAVAYDKGRGVRQDDSEAIRWWQKAADQGDEEAQCRLGSAYATGKGVVKNNQTAYQWFLLAGKRGSENAISMLVSFEPSLSYAEQTIARDWVQEWKLRAGCSHV